MHVEQVSNHQVCDQNYSDAITGQTTHINLASLSSKRAETGGLHGVLKIACGARVMLTTNVDVSDGLVNGARGAILLSPPICSI